MTNCKFDQAQKIIDLRPFTGIERIHVILNKKHLVNIKHWRKMLRKFDDLITECSHLNFIDIFDDLSEEVQNVKIGTRNSGYSLKYYQKEGVNWVHNLFKRNLSGILADEV